MGDVPVLQWEEDDSNFGREVARLGVVTLDAWPARWQVAWQDDFASGEATSLQDAKEKARQFAQVLLRQVHHQLGRVYDPATDRVVIMADAPDTEASNA